MSANKLKYYNVITEHVVMANNKTDAAAVARGRRGVTGKVLASWEDIERVSAAQAKADAEMTA